MTIKEFFLLLISILSSAAGQYFLKLGASKLGKVTAETALNLILNILSTKELLIGLSCYAIGAIAYILLLTRVNLSIAAPSASLIYIFSVMIGYFVFKETIPITRIIGLGLITCGVVLVIKQP